MIEIPLTHGLVALIDDIDADLADFKWYADFGRNGKAYAARNDRSGGRHRKIKMHRVILQRKLVDYQLLATNLCDHRDRNQLNNQRGNLRIATPTQNGGNASLSKNSSTGYKGVTLHSPNGNYVSQIGFNGKRVRLGQFPTALEAAIAYNHAAVMFFGEFAALNDIPGWQEIHPTPLTKERIQKNNKSGYRNVHLQNGKWRAQLRIPGEGGAIKYLGLFESPEEANQAVLNFRRNRS